MLRAFFCAVGISLVIMGGECLVVEKAVLTETKQQVAHNSFLQVAAEVPAHGGRVVEPPEWAPWTLLSVGTVILLYAFTVSRE